MCIRNGPEWWRLRSEFQQGLSRPQSVRLYLPQTDKIIQEFISHLKLWTKSAGESHDFSDELSRLFLECKYNITFPLRAISDIPLMEKKLYQR
jgi:cytochrome P450